MSSIKTLWFGMLTSDSDNAGTESPIVLIINEEGGRFDTLHHTLPDTDQKDQDRGQANLYEITEDDFEPQAFLGATVDPRDLNASSIRIGIRGSDIWRPQSVFIWGEERDGVITPLALETNLQGGDAAIGGQFNRVTLSTDPHKGKLSIAPARVYAGDSITKIRRLILLLTTANVTNAGTDDNIQLQIRTADGRLVVDHIFSDTSQDDLERAQANFYYVPVNVPFTKTELNEESIRLSIKGRNAWLPNRLFLFGLSDDKDSSPEFVMPLVHLPEWSFGLVSAEPGEGLESIVLPLQT